MKVEPLNLATASELLKTKKNGQKFIVDSVADRMAILQAANAHGRIVKTKKDGEGKFKVWVIE